MLQESNGVSPVSGRPRFLTLAGVFLRAVLQKLSEEYVKPCCLFSLGCHSEETGDEGDLSEDVSLFHSMHLPLANHVHTLVFS